jgi:hypothetical protein
MQSAYRTLDATKILTRRELAAVLIDLKRKAPRSKNTRLRMSRARSASRIIPLRGIASRGNTELSRETEQTNREAAGNAPLFPHLSLECGNVGVPT